VLIQALAGAVACAAIAVLAGRLFPATPWGGLAAGLGAAAYGPLVFHDLEILPASLSATFLACGLLAAQATQSRAGAASAGVLLGLAVGFAPGLLIVAVAVIAWTLWGAVGRAAVGRATFLAAGVALVLAPILAWNLAKGGGASLATSAGVNTYIGNNAEATGSFFLPAGSGLDGTDLEGSSRREADRAAGATLSAGEASAYWRGRALAFVRGDPAAWVRLIAHKGMLTINHYEIPNHLNFYFVADRFSPFLRRLISFGVLFPLAGVGAIAAWTWTPDRTGSRRSPRGRRAGRGEESGTDPEVAPLRRGRLSMLACAMLALAVPVLFFVTGRYRLPAAPPLLVLAGGGVAWALDSLQARRVRTVLLGAGLAAVLALASWRTAVREGDYGFDHILLGSVQRRLGDLDAAILEFKLAEETGPARLDAGFRLAQALAERGNAAAARAALRRHLARHPDDGQAAAALAAFPEDAPLGPPVPLTEFEAGSERLIAGDLGAAGAALSRAIAADPVHARALANLAAVRDREGRRTETVSLLERAQRLQPRNPEILRSLAAALFKDGRRDRAEDAATKALQLAPDDGETQALLARIRR
jgi:Flp pilus assembly protein TadD